MIKLNVNLTKNAKSFQHVGILAEENKNIFFEYSDDFLKSNLWLSPFKLPLKPSLIKHDDFNFGKLFGLFDDSLPDGWGLLLMDRYFKSKGITPQNISPLERLAYLGSNTMGALTYHPATNETSDLIQNICLNTLSNNANAILQGKTDDVLPEMYKTGGSPGGARPKVLVGIKDDIIISKPNDLPTGYTPWLIKFFPSKENNEEGLIEYAYSIMAKNAGILMPECKIFTTKVGESFFGIQRFDRNNNNRYHTHTFGNLIHSNFRIPNCDYEMLFKVSQVLTKKQSDVIQFFKIMVFNIFAHNRDDHVKNFSFMMDTEDNWCATPAYDLTFSFGPGGEHSMTIAGEGKSPTIEHILNLAKKASISKTMALKIIDSVKSALSQWQIITNDLGIKKKTIKDIGKYLP